MGGKRPDQYQIDPADSGATDYKTLPQTGRGKSDRNDTVRFDRQRLSESEHDEAEHPQPARHPPPSRDANRPLKAKNVERELQSEPGAAETSPPKENPFV